MNSLDLLDALWVIKNASKILYSQQTENGIEQQLVSSDFANALVNHSNQIPNMMLNLAENELFIIIYEGK